ncbi:hypothetical protein [Accumulibacter sp.]|uniref:hypothetical protein n=1 Tax=Accumulibacter sp. TaxID=2053492 RepID=UPI00159B4C98|nr:MAG: hypothetical protein HT579_01840 [Candidatus Accumulibacter similis]
MLARLEWIELDAPDVSLHETDILAACDVDLRQGSGRRRESRESRETIRRSRVLRRAGGLGDRADDLQALGIDATMSSGELPMPPDECLRTAASPAMSATGRPCRIICASRRGCPLP